MNFPFDMLLFIVEGLEIECCALFAPVDTISVHLKIVHFSNPFNVLSLYYQTR